MEILEKRKDRLIKWFKDPYNLAFVAILIFAIIIRIYYFTLTYDQPLWWDEAEFMNIANRFAFGLNYEFTPVRPILLSFITAIFFKISPSLFLPKVLLLIFSIASVVGVYLLGKELYQKKVGLIAAFIMSVFYLNIFFTARLLVDMPSLCFFIFSALYFYKYFKYNSHKALYIGAILIAIGTAFKQSTGFFLAVVLVYLLITEKLNFLKRKELWISGIIFLLVLSPYLIWGYVEFGGFVLAQGTAQVGTQSSGLTNAQRLYEGTLAYFYLFPTYLSWALLIIFLLGLATMYQLILGFDILVKKGDKQLKKYLFLILIFILPIVLASTLIHHNENRYIINAMPAVFLISSAFIYKAFRVVKKQNKLFATLLLIILLAYVGYFQLRATDSLIRVKVDSYSEIRDAAFWYSDNTLSTDLMATQSVKQIPFYSKKDIVRFPETEQEFEEMLKDNANLKYLMLSAYEKSPEWTYAYPEKNQLAVANAFLRGEQPMVVIYDLESQVALTQMTVQEIVNELTNQSTNESTTQ